MSDMSRGAPRINFVTQLPRDDGCGVAVVQMLTGNSYHEIAQTIPWRDPAVHHMTWDLMLPALEASGFQVGELQKTDLWSNVAGLAVVHVQPDHFIIYDANTGEFFDPGKSTGPSREPRTQPLSFVSILLKGLVRKRSNAAIAPNIAESGLSTEES